MEAKEKAKQLVEKFMPIARIQTITPVGREPYAKQCAIICVDEILKEIEKVGGDRLIESEDGYEWSIESKKIYWHCVKNDIQSL